jgi:hypothetical protein
MQTEELKRAAERSPFQPFGVRLSNGAEYMFHESRDFGARGDFQTIVFFGEKEIVLIDTDNIVEVFSK